MKINNIPVYKPSFGYDKKLNGELKTKLASYPDKEWAETLTTMSSFCNKLEADVIREEKTKSEKGSKFADYLDMFLTYKQMITGFISITFGDLKYADREYESYADEYIKNGAQKEDWRLDACDFLSEWTEEKHRPLTEQNPVEVNYIINNPLPDDEEDDEDISKLITPKQNNENNKTNANTPRKTELGRRSMLEEYTPNKFSPQGFKDVAGMEKLKKDLQDSIVQVLNDPEQAQRDFEDYGKSIPRGVILYGPPGCGKTYISEALASEINAPLYMFSLGKAGSSYVNATANNIKTAFDEAIGIAAKTQKPVLLFMDEVDSVGFNRNENVWAEDIKQVATLLQSLDKAKDSGVIVLAATNKYKILDPAVKRRFDTKVFVDVPDSDSRKALLKKSLNSMSKGKTLALDEDAIEKIAAELDGYSSDSICKISKKAALNALERNRADISREDFHKAIQETTEVKPKRDEYLDENGTKRKIGFGIR